MRDENLEKSVEALRQGDTRAFDHIYERTNRAAWFTILYLVHDKMHAEDILQETYLRAMRSLSQYRAGSNFTAWLCTIARSLALNHLKRPNGKFLPTLRRTPINTARARRRSPISSTSPPVS